MNLNMRCPSACCNESNMLIYAIKYNFNMVQYFRGAQAQGHYSYAHIDSISITRCANYQVSVRGRLKLLLFSYDFVACHLVISNFML